MNYIYIIILCIILSPVSESQNKPKLCIDCKFYTKNFFTSNEFGKCTLFPKEEYNEFFLVNGVNNKKKYQFCCISRKYQNMCGKEGKLYKKK